MTLTVDDAKKWAEVNREELDEARLTCDDETVKLMNRFRPELFRDIWDAGCWIQHVFRQHGGTEEQIRAAQFAHGQRCVVADPWETAVAHVNTYLSSGVLHEQPGEDLAEQINHEVFRIGQEEQR
jgi:hypothetical protein